MKVRVHDGGLQTTVQDVGRKGWQRYGVGGCGAMDRSALQVANLLVGNKPDEAVLEMALRGVELSFDQDAVVALCGADFDFTVEGVSCPEWRPVFVRAGAVLKVGNATNGYRGYLSIAGSWDIPSVLGSKSTYLYGGFGGVDGRDLNAGDELEVLNEMNRMHSDVSQVCMEHLRQQAGTGSTAWPKWAAGRTVRIAQSGRQMIRVLTGPDFLRLDDDAQHELWTQRFRVTPSSNRMGIRMEGKPLSLRQDFESVSKPVVSGTLQRTHDGQLTVLMADGGTTGGYPAVAVVVSVDLPLLAQARPGTFVTFEPVSVDQAASLRKEHLSMLRTFAAVLKLQTASWVD